MFPALLAVASAACSVDVSATRHSEDGVSESDASASDTPPSDGDGASPGDDSSRDGAVDGLEDGGRPPPDPFSPDAEGPFDGRAWRIDDEGVEQLCRLNGTHQKLVVRVRNTSNQSAPEATLSVHTRDTDLVERAVVPALPPHGSADVSLDRALLAGYRDSWTFDVVIDPDGEHGTPYAVSTGVCTSARERATLGVAKLLEWYDPASGAFAGTNFWQKASMVETLLDYMRQTGDSAAMDTLATTFDAQGQGAFLSESYVDEAFWGITWLKAYEITRRQRYLDVARALFGDTTASYGDKCGGGLFWDKPRTRKLATTNALMMKLAARLAMHTTNGSDRAAFLSWAHGSWAWLQNSSLLHEDHQVGESLSASCVPEGPLYTHNQGLVVGGLVEMWRATEDDALLDHADLIAQSVLAKMTSAKGVLLETECDPDCDEDLSLLKGIFARNLAELQAVRPRVAYQTFLLKQADALWALSQNGEHQFGKSWQGPFDAPAAMRQAAAVDALVGSVRGGLANVALLAHASGSAPCIAFESAERAIDGSSRLDSKWCSVGGSGQALDVDFLKVRRLVGFRVRHAGAAGEDAGWNTRDFDIEASLDGQTWQTLVSVVDNVDNVTTHYVLPFEARFARLSIKRTQTREDAPAVRIYDFEAFAVDRP